VRRPAGHGSSTVCDAPLPAGSATRTRTTAVPDGSGWPVRTAPPGTARLSTACGAGSPTSKTCTAPTAPTVATAAVAVAPALIAVPLADAVAALTPKNARPDARSSGPGESSAIALRVPRSALRNSRQALHEADVAVGRGARAALGVVGGEQVALHRLARGVAGVAVLDEVGPRAEDEVLRRLRREAELDRELVCEMPSSSRRTSAWRCCSGSSERSPSTSRRCERRSAARAGSRTRARAARPASRRRRGRPSRCARGRARRARSCAPRRNSHGLSSMWPVVAAQGARGAPHALLHDVLGVLAALAEHALGVAQQHGR
jgi:hypothetical protein